MTFALEFAILFAVIFLQDANTDFQDLGKLLFGGVALAIVVAVGFTIVRFRLRDKKPERSNFISIGNQTNDD